MLENKPWDHFVKEILTGSGSNFSNGPANYWVIHDEASKAAENITLTFLGISVACARCHNHPLDKWTQNDYYGLASFFSRVGRKPGDLGDLIIFESQTGGIKHPELDRALPPRPLGGEPLAPEISGNLRFHFANWLTSSENRYFLRATVNRIWQHFFGRGLVEPVDDMRQTNPASNEALMAALIQDFINHRFDVQHLIRTIMNSATYQASAEGRGLGPLGEYYHSRYPIRRLPAEVILDMICQVTGVPDQFQGFPLGTRALQLPDTRIKSHFLSIFGRPSREINSNAERSKDPTVHQALYLIHGTGLHEKLKSPSGTLSQFLDQGMSNEEVIRNLYWAAFSRPPNKIEMKEILQSLVSAESVFPGSDPNTEHRIALEDLALGLLTSKEFLFNH